jgi:hypothetical protein
MSNYVVSDTSLGSVADAIRNKGKTSELLEYPQGFIDAIDAISGGGDEPIPDDGKTRIFIHIAEGTPDNRLTFYLRFTASVADNTTVDWGDGVSETLGSTTVTNYSHKYPSGGDYVIVMTVNSGTISFVGTSGSSGYSIYGIRTTSNDNYINRSRTERIIFGDDVTEVGDYACYECVGLKSVSFLSKATTIGNNAFQGCYVLSSINIPDDITTINQYTFCYVYPLTQLIIPEDVASVGANAFFNCRAMSEYHFKSATPPTLANSNAFTGINSGCIIYVPKGSLSAYKTATNWSTYASQMREEPT